MYKLEYIDKQFKKQIDIIRQRDHLLFKIADIITDYPNIELRIREIKSRREAIR